MKSENLRASIKHKVSLENSKILAKENRLDSRSEK